MTESRYLLERRAKMTWKAKIKPKEPEKRKELPKRSAKMKVTVKELKKLYASFLKKHPFCEIQGPGCKKIAVCAHHTEGRLPSKILDTTKWVASCAPCNLWVEENHKEAEKKGFKKSKFKK